MSGRWGSRNDAGAEQPLICVWSTPSTGRHIRPELDSDGRAVTPPQGTRAVLRRLGAVRVDLRHQMRT
ncbi:hypothetical protein ACFWIO_40115 [Streptomyces diastatochromogenes]|uniref:hypothetical protein n=1 Tax=Streptomyces diastatochromogenes TaxID=42236 RepID=UPI003652CCC8